MSISVLMPANLADNFDWVRHRINHLYAYDFGYRGEMLVGVWKGHDRIGELEAFCARISPLIRVVSQDPDLFFGKRVLSLAHLTNAPHVVTMGDDDFLFAPALRHAVKVLESDPSVTCAQGRFLRLNLDQPLGSVNFRTFPLWQSLEEDTVARFCGFTTHYCTTWYAVQRTHQFIERWMLMDDMYTRTRNAAFFEYTGEFYAIIKGKFVIADEIYMVRGYHARAGSKIMYRNRSPDVAPWVLLHPDFQALYNTFVTRVLDVFKVKGVDFVAQEKPITDGLNHFLDWVRDSKTTDLEVVEQRLWQILEMPKIPEPPQVLKAIMSIIVETQPELMQAAKAS